MEVILNIIGITIFFLNRLANRRNRESPLSAKFWFRDNWEQVGIIVLFDVALMLLVFQGGLEFNFDKLAPMMPEGMQLAGDSALCFVVGLFLAKGCYEGYKKLFKNK